MKCDKFDWHAWMPLNIWRDDIKEFGGDIRGSLYMYEDYQFQS